MSVVLLAKRIKLGVRMAIFDSDSYKQVVIDWVESQPRKGYGLYSRMAKALGTSSVVVSQIFRGPRDLTLDQAAKVCRFMGLGRIESDHFLLLVQRERAASPELREMLDRQLKDLRSRGQALKNRIEHSQMSEDDRSYFYSRWYVIAIWLAAPLYSTQIAEKISQRFGLQVSEVSDVLQFLVSRRLLVKKGKAFELGTKVTHIANDSSYLRLHHSNWRLKALQAMERPSNENLHYTAPVSLSKSLQKEIRETLLRLIQTQTKQIAASPEETLMCLNLDWFEVGG